MAPTAAGVPPYCGLRADLQAGTRVGTRSAGVNSPHQRRFKETDPICRTSRKEAGMIWLDWLIVASVAVLAAVIFKQWKERSRFVNNLDTSARSVDPTVAGTSEGERDRRPPEALEADRAKRRFPTGTHAFACYKHKFEEMARGAWRGGGIILGNDHSPGFRGSSQPAPWSGAFPGGIQARKPDCHAVGIV